MIIRIDDSAEFKVPELVRFADCHGCELVSKNGEILIRAKGKNFPVDSATIRPGEYSGGHFHQYLMRLI